MNDSTCVLRPSRRTSLANARTASAIIATVALALLLAACGGSPSSPRSGSSSNTGDSTHQSAVAFSRCMRSHGVSQYPDPDSSGNLPKTSAQQLGVSSSHFNAAETACRHLLPSGSLNFSSEQQCYQAGDCPPALVQQMLTVGRKAARCMRNHGVPNWPDPTVDSQGRPFFDISSHGITSSEWHSSQMRAKADECTRIAGGWLATG